MQDYVIFVIGTNPTRVIRDMRFVETISEVKLFYSESTRPDKDNNLLFSSGRVTGENGDTVVRLMFLSGDQSLKELLTSLLDSDAPYPMLGYIVLVDSQYLDLENEKDTEQVWMIEREIYGFITKGWLYMSSAREKVHIFRQIVPDAPFTVAVLNQDTPNAMPLDKVREELELDDDVKIVPCDPKSKADVKKVLLELLNSLETTPTIEQVIDTINQA